jgi:hypothetical protein
MHSHDRTMLSSLGFADPDKKDRRHDLACQYLATPDVARQIVDILVRPSLSARTKTVNERKFRGRVVYEFGDLYRPRFEEPIVKGEGQYRTVVGFLDVVLPFSWTYRQVGEMRAFEGHPWEPHNSNLDAWTSAVILEAKVNPVGVGDIVRQINLYREFRRISEDSFPNLPYFWCVATAFDLSAADVSMLREGRVRHIRLGEAFEEWCVSANAESEDAVLADSINL